MTKQTIADFLANGGNIQKITYKDFNQTGDAPSYGMRELIAKQKMTFYKAKQTTRASSSARRTKAVSK